MTTTERRDLALAELAPGMIALVLRQGASLTDGYVLREDMTLVEATLLFRDILAPGHDSAWTSTLLPEPWRVVALDGRQLHGSIEVVLPAREKGWPQ